MTCFYETIIFSLIIIISSTSAIPKPECKSDSRELWPHDDPNQYWYCDHLNDDPKPMFCPKNRGFLRIEGEISGCVPWKAWQCTSKSGPPSCDGNNYFKPHRHENPNKFWACTENKPGVPSRPVEMDCLNYPINGQITKGNRGFVDNDENLGCVPWATWVCDKADDKSRQ